MEKKKIIEESLKESSSFSSNVHAIETITTSNTVAHQHFEIPQRYHKSRVVLLPVSFKRFYVYWEFTDEHLSSFCISANDLKFQILDENGDTQFEFDCTYPIGEYFINKKFNSSHIHVITGYYKDGEFIRLFEPSNVLKLFDAKLNFAKDQEDVWINKQKGFTEIIRSSLHHFTLGMSSKSYVEELERLREYELEAMESFSSSSLSKGD